MSESLIELIQRKEREGKVVFMTMEGRMEADLDKFIQQPTEGILYDLNRDRATVLMFIKQDNPKWVNDYAVGTVIAKLKELVDQNKDLFCPAKGKP